MHRAAAGQLNLLAPFQLLKYVSGKLTNHPLNCIDGLTIGSRCTVRSFDGETMLAAERGFSWLNELQLATGSTHLPRAALARFPVPMPALDDGVNIETGLPFLRFTGRAGFEAAVEQSHIRDTSRARALTHSAISIVYQARFAQGHTPAL